LPLISGGLFFVLAQWSGIRTQGLMIMEGEQ